MALVTRDRFKVSSIIIQTIRRISSDTSEYRTHGIFCYQVPPLAQIYIGHFRSAPRSLLYVTSKTKSTPLFALIFYPYIVTHDSIFSDPRFHLTHSKQKAWKIRSSRVMRGNPIFAQYPNMTGQGLNRVTASGNKKRWAKQWTRRRDLLGWFESEPLVW